MVWMLGAMVWMLGANLHGLHLGAARPHVAPRGGAGGKRHPHSHQRGGRSRGHVGALRGRRRHVRRQGHVHFGGRQPLLIGRRGGSVLIPAAGAGPVRVGRVRGAPRRVRRAPRRVRGAPRRVPGRGGASRGARGFRRLPPHTTSRK
eukprot:1116794-Prorocentrum_minimum.AAC.2